MGINTVRMFAGFFGALLVGGCGVRAVIGVQHIEVANLGASW